MALEELLSESVNGQTDNRTDGQTDRRLDERTDDGHKVITNNWKSRWESRHLCPLKVVPGIYTEV